MRCAVVARYTNAMTTIWFLVLSAAMCFGAGMAGWALGRARTERRLLAFRDSDVMSVAGDDPVTPLADSRGRP